MLVAISCGEITKAWALTERSGHLLCKCRKSFIQAKTTNVCLLTIKKKLEFEDKLHLLNAAFQRDNVVFRAKGLHDVYVNLTHFENSQLVTCQSGNVFNI